MRISLVGTVGLCSLAMVTACQPAREAPPAPRAAAEADASVPSADGVAIHYHVAGGGALAVVFVHCWSCNSSFWKEEVAHLAPRYLVVSIDLGGHGASGTNRAAWTIPAFAQDVRAVVMALGLKQVVLVGHSMGGYVILEAARLMPDRVVGLVPVDTLQDVDSKWDDAEFARFLDGFKTDFRAAVRRLVTQIVPKTTDPALIDRIANEMGSARPDVGISAMQGLQAYDVTAALREVKVPIHAINGDLLQTKLDNNRKYAPQFDAEIIAGCGHFPMFEATEAFDRLLDSVLQGFATPPA